MRWFVGLFIIFLLMLYAVAKADVITTGNLLPNANDGVDWGSSSTDQINPGGSGTVSNGSTVNGFDVTCAASQANCGYKYSVGGDFEVTGTSTLSVTDVNLTNNNITQQMLDNGVTLDSYIDVANCDNQAGNCEGKSGATDSHTVTINLKDSSGNILSTTTQTRTNTAGFQGNCNGYPTSSSGGQTAGCGQYNDQVIYNGHGSNKFDWSWSGTDNNTGTAQRGGPNLLGAKLTMTYDDTTIADNIVQEIGDIFEELQEEVFEDFSFGEIEELFEEMITFFDEPPPMEEMMTEGFEDMSFEPMLMVIDEMPMEQEMTMEMDEMPMEKDMKPSFFTMSGPAEEEIYEETEELITNFLPMPPPQEKEMPMKEEKMTEEKPMMEEVIEEEPKSMVAAPKEEVKEEEEIIEEEPEQMVEESNEEKIKEEKPDSKTTKKSSVQTKEVAKQEKVQSKTKTTNVKSQSKLINVEKIMAKVDKDIKSISKNLQIKNIIKLEIMASDQASLNAYANTQFYKPKDIYIDQLNIIDNRLIYADKSLASYTQNDKIEIKARKLEEINLKKQRLLNELEILKNGQT